ncbi:MAG: hypothetical protein R3C69_05310 [Geminicoccaceae bacterium]
MPPRPALEGGGIEAVDGVEEERHEAAGAGRRLGGDRARHLHDQQARDGRKEGAGLDRETGGDQRRGGAPMAVTRSISSVPPPSSICRPAPDTRSVALVTAVTIRRPVAHLCSAGVAAQHRWLAL